MEMDYGFAGCSVEFEVRVETKIQSSKCFFIIFDVLFLSKIWLSLGTSSRKIWQIIFL